MRPLAPLSSVSLLLLAFAATGCKGGCDPGAAGAGGGGAGGGASSLSAPSSPRFGGSNCPNGSCPPSSGAPTPVPLSGPDSGAVQRLPAFSDRGVADVSGQPAPAAVQSRAVTPERPGPPPPSHSGVKLLRTQAELDAAVAAGTPMIVKWSAPGCGPCIQIKAGYDAAAEVLDGQVGFYAVEIDWNRDDWPRLPQEGGVPQLAFYENGKLVSRRLGAPSGIPPKGHPANRDGGRDWFVKALADRRLD